MDTLNNQAPVTSEHPVVVALLPSNCPELFGPKGATPDFFRYSRSKQRFVLDKSRIEEAAKDADFTDTAPVGEVGIMQQAELSKLSLLIEEIQYFQHSPSREFERLSELLEIFQKEDRLMGVDLEEVREELETFVSKRPNDMVTEVRAVKRGKTCFWPNHHPAGIWFRSADGQIGADEDGIFFLDAGETEYFRATRFRQERRGPGDYILIDAESDEQAESPIAICDIYYNDEGKMLSEMLEEVAYERFNFYEDAGRLAFQLHTMAKLGVIIGQPIFRLVCETDRYIAVDE